MESIDVPDKALPNERRKEGSIPLHAARGHHVNVYHGTLLKHVGCTASAHERVVVLGEYIDTAILGEYEVRPHTPTSKAFPA